MRRDFTCGVAVEGYLAVLLLPGEAVQRLEPAVRGRRRRRGAGRRGGAGRSGAGRRRARRAGRGQAPPRQVALRLRTHKHTHYITILIITTRIPLQTQKTL